MARQQQLARARLRPDQGSGRLCSGEIGVEKKASLFVQQDHTQHFHRCADVGGPSVLPDYGIVDRLAVSAVPDDNCLPLIGDAYRNRETAARPRTSATMAVVTLMVVCQISSGSCSTQPSAGKCCGNSADCCDRIVPASSKRIARELVVP